MPRIFVSAGEPSGDLYASRLAAALKARLPDADLFGCAGPRMQREGVRAIVDMREIAVVGLVEVLGHLPRIWGCYQRLKRAIEKQRPDVAILTDSPDFHLRLASHLAAKKIPIIYFIAPQAWAWRKGRVNVLRRTVRKLLCIFPFEEEFFHRHQVPATYIGHPLSVLAKPTMFRDEFFARHNLPADLPVYSLLPGSRHGEVERHLPRLIDAVQLLSRSFKALTSLPSRLVLVSPRQLFGNPFAAHPSKL